MSRSQESSTPSRTGGNTLLAGLLCATLKVGCATPSYSTPWPPPPRKGGQCPKEALENMEKMKIWPDSALRVVLDIQQPGTFQDIGIYKDGPITSQISQGWGDLPVGSLLHGSMWTSGVTDYTVFERDSVMVRYDRAQLPDGRVFAVCMVIGSASEGRVTKEVESRPGAAVLQRMQVVNAVRWWP